MIIVVYKASGMKYVLREDASRSDFWEKFRNLKKRCAELNKEAADEARSEHERRRQDPSYADRHKPFDPEQHHYTWCTRTGGMRFELINDRLADGCTQYVGRPDNWPCKHGEPS